MAVLTMAFMFLSFKDPHSYGNTDQVRTTHLSLNLKLDFEKKRISGSCEVTLSYLANEVPFLDLDSRDLTIEKVADLAGKLYPFELGADEDYMGRRLRIHLEGRRPEKLKIGYHSGCDAKALQWLDPVQTRTKRMPFLFTQSQSIFARTWFPHMDSPGVRVSYDATIQAPKGMNVVMSAARLAEDREKGQFRFELKHAIPSYLIAIAAGEFEFQKISERTGVYAELPILEKAAWEFVDMEKMVKAAEELYGAYSWDRWDTIILPPSFPYGGMENPMMTFATPTLIAGDRSLVSVMAHELAHSWSGNLVTNATWDDFWLNEGFTTYFERRIVEKLYGKDTVEMQWLLGQADLRKTMERFADEKDFQRLHTHLEGVDPDEAFSDIPYEKGSNFLRMLETHFGREPFDNFLRTYFKTNAFQSITTAQFKIYLLKELFKGDKAVWEKLKVEEWLEAEGTPSNLPKVTSDRFEKTAAAAKNFAEKGDLSGVKNKTWVTSEWLDFLAHLPTQLSQEQLKQLDEAFGFTQSGNAEILSAWFEIAIPSNYERAYEPVSAFLKEVGRRKFLRPLYKALMDNPKTRVLGREIYKEARSGYHPLAQSLLDPMVLENKE